MGVAYVEMAEPKKAYEAFHQAEGLYKDVVKDEHEACLDRATNLSCLANVSGSGEGHASANSNFRPDLPQSWQNGGGTAVAQVHCLRRQRGRKQVPTASHLTHPPPRRSAFLPDATR
jgi:hypothetical protein